MTARMQPAHIVVPAQAQTQRARAGDSVWRGLPEGARGAASPPMRAASPPIRPGADLSASLHVLRHGPAGRASPFTSGSGQTRSGPASRGAAPPVPPGAPPRHSAALPLTGGMAAPACNAAGAGRLCPSPEVKEEALASASAGGHGVRRTKPSCAGPRATGAARHRTASACAGIPLPVALITSLSPRPQRRQTVPDTSAPARV